MNVIDINKFTPILRFRGFRYNSDFWVMLNGVIIDHVRGFAGGMRNVQLPPWLEGGEPDFEIELVVQNGNGRSLQHRYEIPVTSMFGIVDVPEGPQPPPVTPPSEINDGIMERTSQNAVPSAMLQHLRRTKEGAKTKAQVLEEAAKNLAKRIKDKI